MDVSFKIRARERRRELIRKLVLLGVVTIGAGVVAWLVGLDAWHAVVLGLAVAAVGLGWVLAAGDDESTWPQLRRSAADGTRSEVARLSWTLITQDQVRDVVVLRIREQAERRLAWHQLDLADEGDADGIRELLGAEAYRALRPPLGRPMTFPGLLACVRALERLDAQENRHQPA